MTIDRTVGLVLIELETAIKKHPKFPKDIIHMVAIMAEEAGEAVREANNVIHHGGEIEYLKEELRQTAAMCLRVLLSLEVSK